MVDELTAILSRHLGAVSVEAILGTVSRREGGDARPLSAERARSLYATVKVGVATFARDAPAREACLGEVRELLGLRQPEGRYEVSSEADVVTCRNAARELAETIGFSSVDQTKVATVASELARNIVRYAGRGNLAIRIRRDAEGASVGLELEAVDSGPGIARLEEVLSGRYRSKTGMGLGLLGSRRLMDDLRVETELGRGTRVIARRDLRRAARGAA